MSGQEKRFLVADDDESIRKLSKLTLSSMNFTVAGES